MNYFSDSSCCILNWPTDERDQSLSLSKEEVDALIREEVRVAGIDCWYSPQEPAKEMPVALPSSMPAGHGNACNNAEYDDSVLNHLSSFKGSDHVSILNDPFEPYPVFEAPRFTTGFAYHELLSCGRSMAMAEKPSRQNSYHNAQLHGMAANHLAYFGRFVNDSRRAEQFAQQLGCQGFPEDTVFNERNENIKQNSGSSSYFDFSLVNDSIVNADSVIYGQSLNSITNNESMSILNCIKTTCNRTRKIRTFPMKLMGILSRPELSDIITWQPHGRSFTVCDASKLERIILSRFFRNIQYKSFLRQLNIWGFTRMTQGPDKGAYYHQLFLRRKPNLADMMVIAHKGPNKVPMPSSLEPNFYELAKKRPLFDLLPSSRPLSPQGSHLTAL